MAIAAATESNGAATELLRNILNATPTIYGQLASLSQLRDHNTGRYQHHGLALDFGAGEVHNAIRRSHVDCFRRWMQLNLIEQKADLDLYIASLGIDRGTLVQAWTEVPFWRQLIPASIRGPERKQFVAEAKVLMALLRHSQGLPPDPDA